MLAWIDGILPTEKIEREDIDYGAFVANLGEDYEHFYYTDSKNIDVVSIAGNSNWVGIKNKYFLLSLIPNKKTSSIGHSYRSFPFGNRKMDMLLLLQNFLF